MVDLAKLTADLNLEEGRQKCVYKDSLGYFSIGVGRAVDARLPGTGLSDPEIDILLAHDLSARLIVIQKEPWFLACASWEPRQRALLDWYFQLGNHVYGFKATLAAITAGDFSQAGHRMRQSLWYKQTPVRAERVIRKIETGEG